MYLAYTGVGLSVAIYLVAGVAMLVSGIVATAAASLSKKTQSK